MIAVLRGARLALVVCVAAAVAGLGAAAPGRAADARAAATKCTTPKYPGSGYFTSLKVTGTSCAKGRKLIIAYYNCRVAKAGAKGRCVKRVLDYACQERRTAAIPTEFDATVTCANGKKRVVHSYQQNT